MNISVDTEVITEMAALAGTAFDDMQNCFTLSQSIMSHDDWGCKERDIINDNIVNTKNVLHRVYEEIELFSSVLRAASEKFQNAESDYIKLIQRMDTTIGSVIAIPVSTVSISTVPFDASTSVKASVLNTPIENYSLGNMKDPIRQCEFSSLDFSQKESEKYGID